MNIKNKGLIVKIKENWRLIIVGLIVLSISLNSYLAKDEYSKKNKNEEIKKTEQSKQTKENNSEEIDKNIKNDNGQPEKSKTTIKNIETDKNAIVQIAKKSEGITHLARRAIKEYLKDNGENLSAEQKIYAEDYLSKKTGVKPLEIGEKIKFGKNIIKQSIESAKKLNKRQIKNLSKYVPLVKNLN